MSELCFLPPRLLALAELASPCRVLADIGTDHAHLPVYMVQRGLCEKAFACDVNDGPLKRARNAVESAGLSSQIVPVKSDGLRQVPEEYDTVVIAGMGGDLIARILYEHPPVCAKKLLLQPMTKPETLRRFLFRHGYSVQRERAVSEGEKCYVILEAVALPASGFTETDCYLPGALECNADALIYLEKLLNSHQKRLLGLRRAERVDGDAIAFEEEICDRLSEMWRTFHGRLRDETKRDYSRS